MCNTSAPTLGSSGFCGFFKPTPGLFRCHGFSVMLSNHPMYESKQTFNVVTTFLLLWNDTSRMQPEPLDGLAQHFAVSKQCYS